MVIEDAIRGANHALTVTSRVPRHPDAGLNIILVSLNSLLQAQLVVRRKCQPAKLGQVRRELYVITHAQVESEIRPHPERVLPERAQRSIGKAVFGISNSLHQRARNAQTERLKPGQFREDRRKTKLRGRQGAEVVHAAIVHSEGGGQWEVVEVYAKLGVVPPNGPGKIFGELVALLHGL